MQRNFQIKFLNIFYVKNKMNNNNANNNNKIVSRGTESA